MEKDWLAQLQAKERERTGIKSLKISFNKVFGYFIELQEQIYKDLNLVNLAITVNKHCPMPNASLQMN